MAAALDLRAELGEPPYRRGALAHLFSEYAADESFVSEFWQAKGCSVERLDEQRKRHPDFLVRFPDGSVALCEVKSFGGPETGASDYDLEYRTDHRLSNTLYTGIAQLLDYADPNAARLLVFVNHNDRLTFQHLQHLLEGEWDPRQIRFVDAPTDGSVDARTRRQQIDVFLWFDMTVEKNDSPPKLSCGKTMRAAKLCTTLREPAVTTRS